MSDPQTLIIEPTFPLQYRPSQLPHGLNYDLLDSRGMFLAAVNDAATAKLLIAFSNKYYELVVETQRVGASAHV